jgi:hypothetical protein
MQVRQSLRFDPQVSQFELHRRHSDPSSTYEYGFELSLLQERHRDLLFFEDPMLNSPVPDAGALHSMQLFVVS